MKGSSRTQLWPDLRRRVQGLAASLRTREPAGVVDGNSGNASGRRSYRLYRPGWHHLGARPLVVMLHGCKQDPHDFAAGTRMHARGLGRGWYVLYPGQARQANRMGCWNWFESIHQQRERGEPSILAGMTREIIARHRIDPDWVYVAGLSAGGAMAAILATTHPDLFAAAGIHSGLPPAAASGLVAGLELMKRGPGRPRPGQARAPRKTVPTIVFHGDQDDTVHPGNGEALIAASGLAATVTVRGVSPGGRSYTRTVHHDQTGRIDAEHWVIHGSGHAWSGGDPAGSYTDPLGPDASAEMSRFFQRHRRRALPPPPERRR